MKCLINRISRTVKENRRRQALIVKTPRHELLNIIGDAVRDDNGCHVLHHPVRVFADDLFGEVPVIVRSVRIPDGAPVDTDDFDIGNGYTTSSLDMIQLRILVVGIACN